MTQPWRAPVVVATREEQPGDEFARRLRDAGVQVVAMPTTGIAPPHDTGPLVEALRQIAGVRWVVFTSAHAVTATCGHPLWASTWPGLAERPRVAAVGSATAERLRTFGVPCELTPERSGGRELAAAVCACDAGLVGARVLWPRSDIAQRDLPDALAAAGAIVLDPEAYRTVPVRPRVLPAFTARLDAGQVDAVAFFSPSAAAALADALGERSLGRLAGRTEIASIGPSTSAALDALGSPATIEAQTHTGPGLAAAVLQRLARRKGAA